MNKKALPNLRKRLVKAQHRMQQQLNKNGIATKLVQTSEARLARPQNLKLEVNQFRKLSELTAPARNERVYPANDEKVKVRNEKTQATAKVPSKKIRL